jgi:hypothetical protein
MSRNIKIFKSQKKFHQGGRHEFLLPAYPKSKFRKSVLLLAFILDYFSSAIQYANLYIF